MKEVLFFRRFVKYQGGHLKVWDYFNHVRSFSGYTAKIRFSADSVWDERNPWRDARQHVIGPDDPARPDVLFLEGRDWEWLTPAERERPPAPIINFLQHVRHGFPDNPRYAWLPHRAVRICCSEQVAESVRATGRVNGPVFTIPYGLDTSVFPKPREPGERDIDVLICALKQPALGRRLRWLLWRPRRRVVLLDRPVLRPAFLELLGRARVSVLLPHATEGFYIPALEGMGMGTLVVCPDCVGNRSFCLPERNCFRPALSLRAVRAAAEDALSLAPDEAGSLREAARRTFEAHDLPGERHRFRAILEDVDRLW